jgi:hypothetical protein
MKGSEMSVSVAIASSANTTALIAAAQAREAKIIACKTNIDSFDSKTATMAQMKQYADCVDTVYPSDVSPSGVIAFKVIFVIAIIGMLVGFYKAHKSSYHNDFVDYAMFGFMGFIFLPVASLFVGGVGYGLFWLFT